jgi:hypothetical protein
MGIEDIFRVDWIFVDTIIIILLIILLFVVKIYKNSARWRGSFSNEAITSINFRSSDIKLNTSNISLKRWKVIRNTVLEKENISKPLIVIIRTNHRKKLIHILSEGLVSYGFSVLNIYFKIEPCPNCDPLERSVTTETRYVISAILNYMKDRKLIHNSNNIIINYSKSILSYNSLLIDDKNGGIIIINPKIDEINLRNISEIINFTNLKSSAYFIFSKKSFLFIKNKHLENFLKNYSEIAKKKLTFYIIDNARMSFKYYETMLLSKIIELIEKTLVKSKT